MDYHLLFYFILFYFILFYFILFYFIFRHGGDINDDGKYDFRYINNNQYNFPKLKKFNNNLNDDLDNDLNNNLNDDSKRDNIVSDSYKKIDNNKYYYDNRIHNMGNIGFGGWIHAQFASYATKLIDYIVYDGDDIRSFVNKEYNNYFYDKYNKCPKIIDLCCGVGMSTVINQTGIDTSKQMINKAKSIIYSKNLHLRKGKKLFTKFKFGNAENYGETKDYDCSTIMFALHEMPHEAHKKIIENCFRITRKNIIYVDISPNYTPSKMMLSGEPYLLDYLANFDDLMISFGFKSYEIIPNHVRVWYYTFS